MDLDFQYEGEMNIDAALDPELRARVMPQNRMDGIANVLIFAHADAASGVRNILKMRAGGLEVGPILMGLRNQAHIVTPSITARGLLNMAAIAGGSRGQLRLGLFFPLRTTFQGVFQCICEFGPFGIAHRGKMSDQRLSGIFKPFF